MKKVVLLFPNTQYLSDFVTGSQVSRAEVDTRENRLIATLSADDFIRAIAEFKARLNVEWPFDTKSPFKKKQHL